MANQVALRVLTRPGDDVITSREAHAGWHETGGSAANAGVQLVEIGQQGVFSVDEFEAAIKPRAAGVPADDAGRDREHAQPRRWRRRAAGRDRTYLRQRAPARHRHLSGRRTAVERQHRQRPARSELAAPFELVGVSFSKAWAHPAARCWRARRR